MSATLITIPHTGEMTLIHFFKRMSEELDGESRLVLNHLMRGLAERGWLPSVNDLITGLEARGESAEEARAAIETLRHHRLLTLSEDGTQITAVLGSISAARTPHRGHLDSGVNVFVCGGLELLSLNSILIRTVEGSTECGRCAAKITFRMVDGAITEMSPLGAAGFQCSWDGSAPLADVSQASPLFCSDACMSTWAEDYPAFDGVPMPGDLLLHIGTMMAGESGNARFAMFGIEG